MKVSQIHDLIQRNFVISRIRYADGTVEMVNAETVLHTGDYCVVRCLQSSVPSITVIIGEDKDMECKQLNTLLTSRK